MNEWPNIVKHYESSYTVSENSNINDIWRKTLESKGQKPFEEYEVENLFDPGNRTNSQTLNSLFSIDDGAWIGLQESERKIFKSILKLKQPGYGSRLDSHINGLKYSTFFLKDAIVASKIVSAWDATNQKRCPSILEIGPGLGGLMYVLRNYYGSQARTYLIDLPYNLCLQEWFLSKEFPSLSTNSVLYPSEIQSLEERNQMNFISADLFASKIFDIKNLNFDICINVDSMQEMSRNSIEGYFNFIQSNINKDGIFYFKNHYGHGSDSIGEPEDYPFDEHWKINRSSIIFAHENGQNAELTELIMTRDVHSSGHPKLRSFIEDLKDKYPLLVEYSILCPEIETVSLDGFYELADESLVEIKSCLKDLLDNRSGETGELLNYSTRDMSELIIELQLIRMSELLAIANNKTVSKKYIESFLKSKNSKTISGYWKVKFFGAALAWNVDADLISEMLNESVISIESPRHILRLALLGLNFEFDKLDPVFDKARSLSNRMDLLDQATLISLEARFSNYDSHQIDGTVLLDQEISKPRIAYLLEKLILANQIELALRVWDKHRKRYFIEDLYLLRAFFEKVLQERESNVDSEAEKLRNLCVKWFATVSSNKHRISPTEYLKFTWLQERMHGNNPDVAKAIAKDTKDYFALTAAAAEFARQRRGKDAIELAFKSMTLRGNNYRHALYLAIMFWNSCFYEESKLFYSFASRLKNYKFESSSGVVFSDLVYRSELDNKNLRIEADFVFSDSQEYFCDSVFWKW